MLAIFLNCEFYTQVAAGLLNLRTLKKGLSFISNRKRRKEGTYCASELDGIEPTPPASERAGYARHLKHFQLNIIIIND